MKRLEVLRVIVLLGLLCLFVFQMQNSLRKYLSKPIVQQTSKTSLDNIERPIIYACQENQFKYSESKKHGYQYLNDFTLGNIGNSRISWKGKHGNLTYRALQNHLYHYNYSNANLVFYEYVNKTWMVGDGGLELVFIPAYGFCMKIKQNITSFIALETKQNLIFFIADPSTENTLKISHIGNGRVTLRKNHDNTFEYNTYRMDIHLNNAKIFEGSECQDYRKIGSSYGECIENILKEKLIEWYGCVAPWFPKNTSLVCEIDLEINMANEMAMTNAIDQLYMLASGQELNIFSTCLKPCMTMDLKLRLIHQKSYRADDGGAELSMNDEVVVHTDVIAYDMFSLIVDLGSNLGLWLGLSALSIFDTILQVFTFRCA